MKISTHMSTNYNINIICKQYNHLNIRKNTQFVFAKTKCICELFYNNLQRVEIVNYKFHPSFKKCIDTYNFYLRMVNSFKSKITVILHIQLFHKILLFFFFCCLSTVFLCFYNCIK